MGAIYQAGEIIACLPLLEFVEFQRRVKHFGFQTAPTIQPSYDFVGLRKTGLYTLHCLKIQSVNLSALNIMIV